MVQPPWKDTERTAGGGRRLLLWMRAEDEPLWEEIADIAARRGVARSAVARWLAALGLDVARERGDI